MLQKYKGRGKRPNRRGHAKLRSRRAQVTGSFRRQRAALSLLTWSAAVGLTPDDLQFIHFSLLGFQ